MGWTKTNFDGVWVFEPKIWHDQRGYFIESYNQSTIPLEFNNVYFVQDNEAKSSRGVLRGLHYQLPPYTQTKLVRCVTGEVLDVIVDLRPQSATFGKYLSVILNEINKKQLFIPHGFAHGYLVLSEIAIFAYKCDQYYAPSFDAGIKFDDDTLGIDWILPKADMIISNKDLQLPSFADHKPYVV